MTFYAIEAFSDQDITDNFEVIPVIPHWVKVRLPSSKGKLEYMHYRTLEEASQVASMLVFEDANHKHVGRHITPFRIIKVENKLGKVVWNDPRPAAIEVLDEMMHPQDAIRRKLESI